jgi:iron transport multicopper oxidase
MLLHVLFASAFHLLAVSAATINLDWNVTWVLANPDGLQERPVIGINGQWPPPVLNFTKGDRIVANVYNGLGNESTSIHWHGMYQNGTNYMDGAPGVTQCQIAPGATMIYNFTVRSNWQCARDV